MKAIKPTIFSLFVMLTLAACGGGGGEFFEYSSPAKTIVTGVASKGLFENGTVNIYALLDNGVKGELLDSVITDATGNYTANYVGYTGPILVEASGSYNDEATGGLKNISADAPLRAAIAQAQGTVYLPVTALTEVAVRNAGADPTRITAANAQVSAFFNVDITATQPVGLSDLATATSDKQVYTQTLIAVSQMMANDSEVNNADKLNNVLTSLSQGITSGGTTTTAVYNDIQRAVGTFVAEHPDVSGITATSLSNVGEYSSKSYTLTLGGSVPAEGVYGLQFDLVLPGGITVSTASNGSAAASSLALTGSATPYALLNSRYTAGALTMVLITTQGMTAGGVATLTCNIPPGAAAPSGTDFSVANLRALDARANALQGITVKVN